MSSAQQRVSGLSRAAISGICLLLPVVSPDVLMAQAWTTGFFNTNQGYVRNDSLPGAPTNAPSSQQWYTDDPYDDITKLGDTSVTQYLSGWTPGTSGSGNNTLLFGRYSITSGFGAGRTNPSLLKPFAPVTSDANGMAIFSVDFAITRTVDSSYTNKDSFGFELLDSTVTGGVTNYFSLANFSFNPNSPLLGTNANSLLFQWTRDGTVQSTNGTGLTANWTINYGSLYRFTATMQSNMFDAVIYGLSNVGGTPVSTTTVINDGHLSGSETGADFDTLAINWDITSGVSTNTGRNYLIVGQASVVPEPSVCALLVAGLAVVGFAVRRRRCL